MQILIVIALIIIGVLLFELIIFSHELGHFITAKLSGVRVNEFALGMGPKLFGFTKGETRYSFRLFPIGGYCAMEGEDEDSENPHAFNNAKIWKRMIIIIAGAVMNIILGFLLMFVYTVQSDSFASTTVSGFVPNSFTANSGLQEGDQIVDVNGYSVWNSRDLQFSLATLKSKNVDGTTLEVYKEDASIELCKAYSAIVNEQKPDEEQTNLLYKTLSEYCAKVNSSTTKDEATTVMTNGINALYENFDDTEYEIPSIEERETRERFVSDVTVIRNGEKLTLNDVQFYTYYASEEDKADDKPTLAFDFYLQPIEKNIGTVISQTFTETCSMVKTVWTSLVWLVQGRFSFTDLSGPVGIATAVTTVASQGLELSFGTAVNNILFVMILITVNLGIVNMLPFPALDGGRFLMLLIEWIFKKPVPRKAEQIINTVGMILLFGFMIVISFKDIWQLVTGTMPGVS